MQSALTFKRKQMGDYIKFISHFGPAVTGMTFWNSNKTTKAISEVLTITDEAFIHLCIINYSATWMAQDKRKQGDYTVNIPVSTVHCMAYFALLYCCKELTKLLSLVSKVY